MIDYRILHDPAQLEHIVDLEVAVWGLNPRNAVPSALLHVMALGGGLVMGAYHGDRMVGLLVSLPVNRDGNVFLWSHMTGTHPDYQRRGIGLELKRRQRLWALDYGYKAIGWTFDPLQRGNAWFNLHLLGVDAALTIAEYHVNFYGDMDDDINRGLPSDRVEVCWQIDQPSRQRPTGEVAALLIDTDADGLPVVQASQWDQTSYAVPVPSDLTALRRENFEAVLAWRIAVRDALVGALGRGYDAVDFVRQGEQYVYWLSKQEALS